jgi:oligoendopeptidase F
MFTDLPRTANDILDWSWDHVEPYYTDLAARSLDAATIMSWLQDWTRIGDLTSELASRLYVATTRNTADTEAEQRYHAYLNNLYPAIMAAEQSLRQKLLDSGLEPAGLAIPLRTIRAEAALYREANLPLLAEEQRLCNEYNKIVGAQTIEWEGGEATVQQLQPVYQQADRPTRKRAWRLVAQRQHADRAAINELWGKFMHLRRQIAANTGLPDYRAYSWQALGRFDYTPENCFEFQQAIEAIVVPAAQRIYEKRRQRLGLDRLRPWDVDAQQPLDARPLRPFADVTELEAKAEAMLRRVDPELGGYFATMRRENLLDLDNRKNKGPGGYCTAFDAEQRPFIFMNAVGVADNVRTILHEAGHAFQVFEGVHLPYRQQREVPMEFSEVASMAMELLASPYLTTDEGGFYTAEEAARARIDHLEHIILFWPYMAVVDAFQHWVYTNHTAATDPANCDAQWAKQWQRFMCGIDWSGLETEMSTGWQRKQHIHRHPFYYIEYGLAQLGAIQVWRNALRDQANAVSNYRKALALGGTVALPDLYNTAGARFAFDHQTVQAAVDLLEATIAELGGSYE